LNPLSGSINEIPRGISRSPVTGDIAMKLFLGAAADYFRRRPIFQALFM